MTENKPIRVSANWKKRFFTIWTGQAFSLFGSNLVQFALVWWITQKTGSATILATATMVALLPQIFLGPIAGALIDRWNRRLVLIVADGGIAFFTLCLGILFLFGHEQIWQIYVIMFIRSIGGSFHWPTMQASTSLMAPDEQLSRIAGLNQTLQGAMNIVAPPVGAILLTTVPMYGIILIDVVTALIAIIPLFFFQIPQPEAALRPQGTSGANAVIKDMLAGFRYVASWPGMLIILIIATVLNFLINPAFSLMPLLVTKVFMGTAYHLGMLDSVFGIGVVVGGLILSTWGGFKKRIITAMLGLIGMGAGLLMVGLSGINSFWMAVIGMTLGGFMNPLVNGPLFAIVQSVVEPSMQGRVFTLIGSLSAAMSPLSLAVAGPLADTLGIPIWYIIAGIACILIGIVSFAIKPVMKLEDGSEKLHPAVPPVLESTG